MRNRQGDEIGSTGQSRLGHRDDAVVGARQAGHDAAKPDAARAGEHAVLSVADTGAGIGPEALARVFDPFTSERPVRGSLGLGLTIVKRLVECHGGSIKVTSTPGQGSCFEVVLPVAPSRLYEQRGEAAA